MLFNTYTNCKHYRLSFTAPYIPIAKARGFTAQPDKDLTYDTDFADEGWAAGYAGCVPDDELLENEAFMDGYDCGYTTRFY